MFKKIDFYRMAFIASNFEENGVPDEVFNLSIAATMVCVPLVTIMTPIFIYFHIKHKKANRYPNGQKTLDQIATIIFVPSVCCTLLSVHITTEYLMNGVVNNDPNAGMMRIFTEVLILIATAFSFLYSAVLLVVYNFFFSSLLNIFIVLLAVQRFVVIYLQPKYHVLVGERFLNLYISMIWAGSLIYKMYLFACFYATRSQLIVSIGGIDISKLYSIMNILSFGSIILCSVIYCALFWSLFKIPRLDRFYHPEFVFLYESIPLVITRGFLFYYTEGYDSFENKSEFHTYYMDHEMRYVIISTALVQFTYIFSLQSVYSCYLFLKKKQYLKLFRSNSQVEASQMAAIATFD